jgi:hypothetical protein
MVRALYRRHRNGEIFRYTGTPEIGIDTYRRQTSPDNSGSNCVARLRADAQIEWAKGEYQSRSKIDCKVLTSDT